MFGILFDVSSAENLTETPFVHIIEDMLIYSRIDPFDGENIGKLEGGSAMKAVEAAWIRRHFGSFSFLPACCLLVRKG